MFIGYISAALAWKIIISKEKKNYISSKLNKTQCLLGTSDSSSNVKRERKKAGFQAENGQFMCEFICKTDFKTYFILAVPIKCVPFLFRSGCCLMAPHNLVSPEERKMGWMSGRFLHQELVLTTGAAMDRVEWSDPKRPTQKESISENAAQQT